jgi:hypothetical protein
LETLKEWELTYRYLGGPTLVATTAHGLVESERGAVARVIREHFKRIEPDAFRWEWSDPSRLSPIAKRLRDHAGDHEGDGSSLTNGQRVAREFAVSLSTADRLICESGETDRRRVLVRDVADRLIREVIEIQRISTRSAVSTKELLACLRRVTLPTGLPALVATSTTPPPSTPSDASKAFATLADAVAWYLEPIDSLLSMIAERERTPIGGRIVVYGRGIPGGLLDTLSERFLSLQDWCRQGYRWVGPEPLNFAPPENVSTDELKRRSDAIRLASGYGDNFKALLKSQGPPSRHEYVVDAPTLAKWRSDVAELRRVVGLNKPGVANANPVRVQPYKFLECGPYLHAVGIFCPVSFQGIPWRCETTGRNLPESEWRARWDAKRAERGVFLPGDFVQLGGPPARVLDDDSPYDGMVHNVPHGDILTDWLIAWMPGRSNPIRSWRLRRIADLAGAVGRLRSMVLESPHDAGRLQDGEAFVMGEWQLPDGSRWSTHRPVTTDGRRDVALSGFVALNILAAALRERLTGELARVGPATVGRGLRLLATASQNPLAWSAAVVDALGEVSADLLALDTDAGRGKVAVRTDTPEPVTTAPVEPSGDPRAEARIVPAAKLHTLKPHEKQAYQLSCMYGMTQEKIADALNKQHGTLYKQGQVSRMIARAKTVAEANGLAELMSKPAERPRTVDPSRLDLGPRVDKRKPRPSDMAGVDDDEN